MNMRMLQMELSLTDARLLTRLVSAALTMVKTYILLPTPPALRELLPRPRPPLPEPLGTGVVSVQEEQIRALPTKKSILSVNIHLRLLIGSVQLVL